jgi:hypothetical protein
VLNDLGSRYWDCDVLGSIDVEQLPEAARTELRDALMELGWAFTADRLNQRVNEISGAI